MPNLYQNPAFDPKNRMAPAQLQHHFDAFYEDIWCEMCKYGELEELVVCDNNNDREFRPSPRTPLPGTRFALSFFLFSAHELTTSCCQT